MPALAIFQALIRTDNNKATCFSIRNLSSSVICPDFNTFERKFARYIDVIGWNFPSDGVGALIGFARFLLFF